MITLRRAEDRRHVRSELQDTWMSFDPENPADPFRNGFRTLESLNEETPISEMSLHPHTPADIEIVTYVQEGALIDQDRAGMLGRMNAGEFQRTSACQKARHRVINGSFLDPAHVFQSCIMPEAGGLNPGSERKRFPAADREGTLRLVASPDGRGCSLRIQQDIRMYSSILLVGHHLIHAIGAGRGVWLHVIKGRVHLRDHSLGTGDAACLEDETAVSFTAEVPSETLLFDMA